MNTSYGNSPHDLTACARIRRAALELFADRGVEATSIRDIAARAQVSPGAVQHHFCTKIGLRDAVGNHIRDIAATALGNISFEGTYIETEQQMTRAATEFVRNNGVMLRFTARGVADGDEQALQIFDDLVILIKQQWTRLRDTGKLAPDTDVEWMALHSVTIILGTTLMHRGIERHLPAPLADPEQLNRWNQARVTLFRKTLEN